MENMQDVDVVIPTYNGAAFVADAINSVLQQTIRPREIIVVDDGSTDNTDTVLASFGSAIRVIKHSENRGLPAARNTGIRAGSAPLIAFLDADDVWLSNKLERQLPEFSGDLIPGLCYTSLVDCDINLKPIRRPRRFRRRVCEYVFEELFVKAFPIPPSTVIVSREAIVRCGNFDETMFKIEDYECWLRMTMLYSVSCVPETLVFRRIHEQAITSTYIAGETLEWVVKVFDRCDLAARKFNIALPMPIKERKILTLRRLLYSSLRWNDKVSARFYKGKLMELGYYSIVDMLIIFLLATRTRLLVFMAPITRKAKNFLATVLNSLFP